MALINPVGAAGVTATALSISADLSRIALDKSFGEVIVNQSTQVGFTEYLRYVKNLPSPLATRVTATIDLMGGWEHFSKAMISEEEK